LVLFDCLLPLYFFLAPFGQFLPLLFPLFIFRCRSQPGALFALGGLSMSLFLLLHLPLFQFTPQLFAARHKSIKLALGILFAGTRCIGGHERLLGKRGSWLGQSRVQMLRSAAGETYRERGNQTDAEGQGTGHKRYETVVVGGGAVHMYVNFILP
jgi:hypothetical protein